MASSANLHPAEAPVIVWFRDDLRLCDNPALTAAAQSGRKIRCVFVYDEESDGLRPLGAAAKWWLHGALENLDKDLRQRGTRLSIYRGRASELIPRLATLCRAAIVYWNDRYGEAERRVDSAVQLLLEQRRIDALTFNGSLLYDPAAIKTKSGEPFRTFSAFWRAVYQAGDPAQPQAAPVALQDFGDWGDNSPRAVELSELCLEPRGPDWSGGLRSNWKPGETGAQMQLKQFLDNHFDTYAECRDFPDRQTTSHLSPYLRFGNISPRQIWHAAESKNSESDVKSYRNLEKFQSELGWREFSYHLLHHNPTLAARNLQSKFDRMPWREDPVSLRAWQIGKTGYPLVDAGMRQLWTTGWMHNRVRMVAASFLVKHLLIDWRQGEAWFWDTLVDADQANNAASWQWVAGSGADAAPYFRIFNPTLQGENSIAVGITRKLGYQNYRVCLHKTFIARGRHHPQSKGIPRASSTTISLVAARSTRLKRWAEANEQSSSPRIQQAEATTHTDLPCQRTKRMARMRRKIDLPSKTCPVCRRQFSWRRKWARNWDQVTYCSKRCRDTKGKPLQR